MATDHAVMMTTADGPGYTADNTDIKQPWISAWSYMRTSIEHNQFGGAFYQYLVRNDAGTWMGPVCINGGMLDGTTGREQGCYDVTVLLDGAPAYFTFTGRFDPWGPAAASDPGFMCWPPDILAIGSIHNRWASLFLTEHPPRPGMPPGVRRCVKVNGGFVPIYE
jgi:hypothetical protein